MNKLKIAIFNSEKLPIIGFLRILDMLFYVIRAMYAVNFVSPFCPPKKPNSSRLYGTQDL